MIKRWILVLFLLLGFLVACSNGDESAESMDTANTEEAVYHDESSFTREMSNENEVQLTQEDSSNTEEVVETDRKIIYTAHLDIEVKNLDQAISDIQEKASNFGGYIVDSRMQEESEEISANGHITARIPEDRFQEFIQLVEEGSSHVRESSVSGQDITEEYTDLESRLKSKQVVEERLLSFMDQAEKTEDLLAISNDLANVQEEIEELTGRMNYLQDKSDLATVTIYLKENDVSISGIGEAELNTWEKTQQQLLKSINFLISAFSSLFVFIVGNLPIFLLLGTLGVVVFWIVRKKRKNKA